ncbi:DUF1461 domain-containing protein [Candidatus Woesearchaeota archaeon]|nr:DUF1461 domain-containing protein [Candidatus Woesearchaeota archaeon]
MNKNLNQKFLIYFLSLLLCFIIILLSSYIVVYDKYFYNNQFIKNDIYQKFDNQSHATLLVHNLLDYFSNESYLIDVYSPKETKHLRDVKELINNLQTLFFILLFVFIFSLMFIKNDIYENLSRIFIYAFYILLAIILLLYLFSFFSFDFLFDNFHKFLFTDDSWILSNDSLLISLFPISFFFDAFKRILIISLIFGFSLFLSGKLLRKRI